MQVQYLTSQERLQASAEVAQQVAQALEDFLSVLVGWLDAYLDKRLVRTFVRTIQAIITFRQRATGLLLTELGAYLESPERAPAGTKRLSNLLRTTKWAASLIERFLWQRADQYVADLEQAGEEGLVRWDESVLEKSESIALEGLCAVRSSKAARLKRIKPGYYTPPGWPSHFRSRHELAGGAAAGSDRPARAGCHALVDHPRPVCPQPTR
jgi:hypothetical protein